MAKSCDVFEEKLICDHFEVEISDDIAYYYKIGYKCGYFELISNGYICNSKCISKNKEIIYDFTTYKELKEVSFERKNTNGSGDLKMLLNYVQTFLDDYYNKFGTFYVNNWKYIYYDELSADNSDGQIYINCNSESELYGKCLVYSSVDDGLYSIVSKNEVYRGFEYIENYGGDNEISWNISVCDIINGIEEDINMDVEYILAPTY